MKNRTDDTPSGLMRSIIERIATGPELSKDISEEEARAGMSAVLEGAVDDVQAALFLIALRMKRETQEENRGVLNALVGATERVRTDVDTLLELADPYNGFARCIPVSPFLPSVMAACGVPCLTTGLVTTAPKFGLTAHQVLEAAGKSVELKPAAAAAQISNNRIGWAYLDQSEFNPKLHQLAKLRRQMVKRSCISTCEVMLRPVEARTNVIISGYVHRNYPPIYADLARSAGYDLALIVKGVEGGVVPTLQAKAKLFRCGPEAFEVFPVSPRMAGLDAASERALPRDANENPQDQALRAGLGALRGEPGLARLGLIYSASFLLHQLGRCADMVEAAALAGTAIDCGEALRRFDTAT